MQVSVIRKVPGSACPTIPGPRTPAEGMTVPAFGSRGRLPFPPSGAMNRAPTGQALDFVPEGVQCSQKHQWSVSVFAQPSTKVHERASWNKRVTVSSGPPRTKDYQDACFTLPVLSALQRRRHPLFPQCGSFVGGTRGTALCTQGSHNAPAGKTPVGAAPQ